MSRLLNCLLAFCLLSGLLFAAPAQAHSPAIPSLAGTLPGDLDSTFGTNGIVSNHFTNKNDLLGALLVQPDDKIVAAGFSTAYRLLLVRYTPSGSLDASFGSGGIASLAMPTSSYAGVNILARQPDGKLLAAGWSGFIGASAATIWRSNPDGSPDLTFGGGNGYVSAGPGVWNRFFDLELLPDGKILAAGSSMVVGNTSELLAKFNADGSPDTTFGANGIASYTPPNENSASAEAMVVLPDGKILTASAVEDALGYTLLLTRFTAAGAPDTSFHDGQAHTWIFSYWPHNVAGMERLPDGKLLVAGTVGSGTDTDFAVAQLTSGYFLDTSFGGGDGIASLDLLHQDTAARMALAADGKILVAGTAGADDPATTGFALARFKADGSPDTYFGLGDGAATEALGLNTRQATAMALQPDGKIIVGGKYEDGTTTAFGLARFWGGVGVDTTPPVWNSFVGGLQEAYQVGDGKVRLYWEAASDPESSPVTYRLYDGNTYYRDVTCTRPRANYDCMAELDQVAKTSFSFNLRAVNAIGLEAADSLHAAGFSVTMYDYKGLREISQALGSDPPTAILNEGTFVAHVLPQNDVYVPLVELAELADLLASLYTKKWLDAAAQMVGIDPLKFVKDALKAQLSFQVAESAHAGDSPASIVLSPVEENNHLEQGRPYYVQARVVKTLFKYYTVYVTAFHPDEESYSFLPAGYSAWRVPDLAEEQHLNAGLIGQKGGWVGVVHSICVNGSSAYLKMEHLPDSFEDEAHGLAVYVKMVNSASVPAVGATISAYGRMAKFNETSYSLDSTQAGGVSVIAGTTSAVVTSRCDGAFDDAISVTAESPVDLHLYDLAGHHYGALYDANGNVTGMEEAIADVLYSGTDDEPEFLRASGNRTSGYRVEVQGRGSGQFTLTFLIPAADGATRRMLKFRNVPVQASTRARLTISNSSNLHLEVDAGGDGQYEQSLAASVDVTYGAGEGWTIHLPGIMKDSLAPPDDAANPWLLIPAGSFPMGCNTANGACPPDELPLHNVYLDAYEIETYEVTNAQYQACTAAGGCTAPDSVASLTRSSYYGNPAYADFPMVNVTWDQAVAFCTWAGGRLPTEAEWEKAARGADQRLYPWGNQEASCSLANANNCTTDTTRVGSYPAGASPYGLMDMAGNVIEWVHDWYDSNYYAASPDTNPQGPAAGIPYWNGKSYRVVRGGSLVYSWGDAMSSARTYYNHGPWYVQAAWRGFRCVR